MNAQATRTADQARSWRLRPWPNDPTVAQLVFLDHLTIPTDETVAIATAQARARGALAVRTSALFPRAAEVVLSAGYSPVDTLALLRLDLETTPTHTSTTHTSTTRRWAGNTRPMRPRHLARAAEIDTKAFGVMWGNDTSSLCEIRAATPVYRARVAGQRPGFMPNITGSTIAGFAITGAAGRNGYLQRIAVYPHLQHCGIGTALVADAVAWMRAKQLTSVLVNTGVDNTPALALYERFGFQRLREHLVIAEHRFTS